jgi:hypothetical protein
MFFHSTDARELDVQQRRVLVGRRQRGTRGTHFTCFTGPKLQILTLGGASKGIRDVCGLFFNPLLQFACFTGTNVRILTMRFARKAIRDVFGFLIPLLFVVFLLGTRFTHLLALLVQKGTRFTRFTSTKDASAVRGSPAGCSMYLLY